MSSPKEWSDLWSAMDAAPPGEEFETTAQVFTCLLRIAPDRAVAFDGTGVAIAFLSKDVTFLDRSGRAFYASLRRDEGGRFFACYLTVRQFLAYYGMKRRY